MVGSSPGRPNSGSVISASSPRTPGMVKLLLARLWLFGFALNGADEHGAFLVQRFGPPRHKHEHDNEANDHESHKDVWCQVDGIGWNRPHRDKHNRQQQQCAHDWHNGVSPYAEVGGAFAPDEGGEREVCQYVEYDNGQCGDSAEEAEDLTGSEEDADEHETQNLEDLLDMYCHIRRFMPRVNLCQGGWKRPGKAHGIHDAGGGVGTGDAHCQGAVDDG